MNLLKILQENRLLKTPQEIKLFEETLEKIAKYPKDDNLKELHLILDPTFRTLKCHIENFI